MAKQEKKKQAKLVRMPAVKKDDTTKEVIQKSLTEKEEPAHFHDILKHDPLNRNAYQRLMILYRKQKNYRKELSVINAGIKAFESMYNTRKNSDRKVNTVSKKLNELLGLTNKKGQMNFEQEPLVTWRNRREQVLKKMAL